MKALGDDESYVFLAAAHALSAIADAAPGEVMPYLLEQFETEKREKTSGDSERPSCCPCGGGARRRRPTPRN